MKGFEDAPKRKHRKPDMSQVYDTETRTCRMCNLVFDATHEE